MPITPPAKDQSLAFAIVWEWRRGADCGRSDLIHTAKLGRSTQSDMTSVDNCGNSRPVCTENLIRVDNVTEPLKLS